MLLNKKNLVDELLYNRSKFISQAQLLTEVRAILNENDAERTLIKTTLKTESSTKANKFEFDLLETNQIFHVSQIKKVCIDYRLRFLDSNLFKNVIPEEAITKISALEKNHETKLEGFKIIAPSKAFQLIYYDDPLLFAPLGNDYYYLIHKWGNDLTWYRKLSVLPFKNIMNFVVFCGVISALIIAVAPLNNLSKDMPLAPIILFLFMFKAVIASIAYYFFLAGKNFNSEIWDRKFKEN